MFNYLTAGPVKSYHQATLSNTTHYMPITKHKLKRRDQNDIEKRDIFGRNLSYLLTASHSLNNPKNINVYSYELESGNTPMHVLLSQGRLQDASLLYNEWKSQLEYMSHKLKSHIFEQYNRDGLNPLELYYVNLSNSFRRGPWPKYLTYPTGKFDISIDPNHSLHWDQDVAPEIKSTFNKFSQWEGGSNGGSHILTLGSNTHYKIGRAHV